MNTLSMRSHCVAEYIKISTHNTEYIYDSVCTYIYTSTMKLFIPVTTPGVQVILQLTIVDSGYINNLLIKLNYILQSFSSKSRYYIIICLVLSRVYTIHHNASISYIIISI